VCERGDSLVLAAAAAPAALSLVFGCFAAHVDTELSIKASVFQYYVKQSTAKREGTLTDYFNGIWVVGAVVKLAYSSS